MTILSPDQPLSAPIVELIGEFVSRVRQGDRSRELVGLIEALAPPTFEQAPRLLPPAVHGSDVVFVIEATGAARLTIEDADPVDFEPVPGTTFQFHLTTLEPGHTYNYAVVVDGAPLGMGISPHAVAVYGDLSYPVDGVPAGHLTDRRAFVSRIYDGADVEYRIYRNHGVDPAVEAPLMVWLDGQSFVGASDAFGARLQIVTDNLVHLGLIPPMNHLLLPPAAGGSRVIDPEAYHTRYADFRIHQYDEVSDEFVRHLVEEVLPEVSREVAVRQDAYSRAIYGASSGGACAFKVGWFAPDSFGRLYPYIASFTAWGWRPGDGVEGGHVLPLWVRGGPKKNLRIWMSAGYYDEFDYPPPPHLPFKDYPPLLLPLHRAGSQSLGQFEMAHALATSGYDFHFRYGTTGHNSAQSAVELPEALSWLWREYDPSRTEEDFVPDRAEHPHLLPRFDGPGLSYADLSEGRIWHGSVTREGTTPSP